MAKPVSKRAMEGATAATQIPATAHTTAVADMDYQFTYTGKVAMCDWSRNGIKIHFPADALPDGVDECKIDIALCLLDDSQFVLPPNTAIASGIYSITSTCTFTKAVTLEIQHSVAQTSDSALKFVTANRQQPTFDVLEGGVFPSNTRYGRIETTHFCLFAIISYCVRGVLDFLFGLFGYRREISVVYYYTARLFYIRGGANSWEVHLVITRDLCVCERAVESYYSQKHAIPGSHQQIEFQGEAITFREQLQRPWGVEHDGWKIVPLTLPLRITKERVNRYRHGMPNTTIPCCQFRIRWNIGGQAVYTHYLLWLDGDGGNRSFNMECKPTE